MKNYNPVLLAAVLGLFALSPARSVFATTYLYEDAARQAFDGAGNITSIVSTYDSTAHNLTWTTTINSAFGGIADSYWLVLDSGSNPKGTVDQLPIFYFDATKSYDSNGLATGIAPTLTAYAYNGLNSGDSFSTPGVGLLSSLSSTDWNSSNLLSATGNGVTRTFSFSIDTTSLDSSAYVASRFAAASVAFNSSNWEGAGYGNEIGVWFHPTINGVAADPTYCDPGYLTSFPVTKQGWYDTEKQLTTVVPEPSSAWLAILAVGVISFRRRWRKLSA